MKKHYKLLYLSLFIVLCFSGCQDYNKNFEIYEIKYTSSIITDPMSENLVQSDHTEQNIEASASEIVMKNDMEVVSIVSDFAYEPRRLEEKAGSKQ